MDIRDNKEAVEAINAILKNKGIAEIKVEHGGIAVVEITRKLKTSNYKMDRTRE